MGIHFKTKISLKFYLKLPKIYTNSDTKKFISILRISIDYCDFFLRTEKNQIRFQVILKGEYTH